MVVPEINWYFDRTVQEQLRSDDTGVTAVHRGLGAADLRQTAAASGGNIPKGKLLVVLVEIKTPNPGSGLSSAKSEGRKTMPMEAPSDPVDRQLFLDVFAKKDWNCCSSSVPLQRGH
jgi:hypothetical protein